MRKKITINLATYPKTKSLCIQVLESLVRIDCDAIRVYLNEYAAIPKEFPKDPKIHYHLGKENLMDSGKFYFMQPGEYYFTIDDDLIYSPEYFKNSLLSMVEHGAAAVTIYGKILAPQPKTFYHILQKYAWNQNQGNDVIVNMPGTGVSLFDTDRCRFNSAAFKHHGMADLEVARIFQINQLPIICRKHKGDEVAYIGQDLTNTLWDRRGELVDYHQEILASIAKWKNFPPIKYLWISNHIHKNLIDQEKLTRSGQYLWIRAMSADVCRWVDIKDMQALKEYDYIHLNLAPNDLELPSLIREAIGWDGKTKIICQADHGVDIMERVFNFQRFRLALDAADMVLAVETHQYWMLNFLCDRPVYLINNPIDLTFVRGLPRPMQQNKVGVISHHYTPHESFLGQAFFNSIWEVDLLGYRGKDHINLEKTYSEIFGATDYLNYLKQISSYKVLVDGHLSYSIGRSLMDAAALGIPMVCSERTEMAKALYPFTIVNPYDLEEINWLTNKLMSDICFYKKVSDHAYNEVEKFGIGESKKKLLQLLK